MCCMEKRRGSQKIVALNVSLQNVSSCKIAIVNKSENDKVKSDSEYELKLEQYSMREKVFLQKMS